MGQLNEIKIIYEDNHLLVVEKPSNMLTQSDITGDADLLSVLKEDLRLRYNKPGEAYLGLVHRLDRPVGGVMVFAKTSKAASRLSEQIRNRNFKKYYYAVVHGMPEKSFGTLEDYLYKDEETNTVSVVSEESGKGKIARLDYEVLESWEGMSLVKINLYTGRSHQIRVQFANAGNPLYGDKKYGYTHNKIDQQIALWSGGIVLTHPTLKEELAFSSKPPEIYPWSLFKNIN
jgi:Pseudouridylate synthases, 23S RNA-specific